MKLLEVDIPLPYAEHAFGTKGGSFADSEETVRSYAEVLGPIAHLRQVHSDRILQVNAPGRYEEADALYTANPNIWLAVKTADCVPVLVSCPHAVAAVHCGWRGLESEILPKTIHKLMSEFDVAANDIFIHIGPCIQPDIYEVDDHFKNIFDEEFIKPSKNKGKVMLDMPMVVASQAKACGVPMTNIVDTGLCTYTEEELFNSYRRAKHKSEEGYKVQLSLVRRHEG